MGSAGHAVVNQPPNHPPPPPPGAPPPLAPCGTSKRGGAPGLIGRYILQRCIQRFVHRTRSELDMTTPADFADDLRKTLNELRGALREHLPNMTGDAYADLDGIVGRAVEQAYHVHRSVGHTARWPLQ